MSPTALRGIRRSSRAVLLFPLLSVLAICCASAGNTPDPITAEIDHWTAFLRADTSSFGLIAQLKPSSLARLEQAKDAARHGWLLLALQRLSDVRANLSAAVFERERPAAARADVAGLEAEWKRIGAELRPALERPAPNAFSGIAPAAFRAMAEAARLQVRAYYDASVDYGRNTQPLFGLYYLGLARANENFATLCRRISTRGAPPPPLRNLSADLDSLEGSLLEAYQPPASIDRHPDFIAISAAIKEARELNDAGLRYGALLRYLQAARRLAMLTSPASADTNGLAVQLEQMSRRLASGKIDHSIGRLFLETAWAAPDSNAKEAVAIVKDVLPRYFVALQPAPPSAPRPPAEATVTLVRWPYT